MQKMTVLYDIIYKLNMNRNKT